MSGRKGKKRKLVVGDYVCVRRLGFEDFDRFLFMKKGDDDSCLLVANIDPWTSLQDIQAAFEEFGVVHAQITKPGEAEVILESVDGLQRAINSGTINLNTKTEGVHLGYEKWASECQASKEHPEKLQDKVSRFMEDFDKKEAREKLEMAKDVVDEDGFTVVSKKRGRRGAFDGEIHVKTTTRVKKAKETQNDDSFYTFKAQEKKQKQLMELRKKFESDKAKVKEMREKRKFKL